MMRRVRHRLIAAGIPVCVAGIACIYYFVSPSSGLLPGCVIYRFTGLKCPGCGSQRFVHAALHGHWLEALNYNWLMPLLLAFLSVMVWVELTGATHPRRYARFYHPAVAWGFMGVLLAWTVARNIFGL